MFSHCDRPIGVFDSGVGGISVLAELLRVLPRERYIYFADTANAPVRVQRCSRGASFGDAGC